MRSVSRRLAFQRLTLLSIVIITVLALFAPTTFLKSTRAVSSNIVISEIQIAGSTVDVEFVELYNPTNSAINLNGWRLSAKTQTGATTNNLLTSFSNIAIQSHGFLLIASPEYSGGVTADLTYSTANHIASNNTVILFSDAGTTVVDKVGLGTATDREGTAIANPATSGSVERKTGASNPTGGNGTDTDDNSNDFTQRSVSEPQNSSSSVEPSLSTATNTLTSTSTNISTLTRTSTSTSTRTSTSTNTSTSTSTQTRTNTPTQTNTLTLTTSFSVRSVVINEVAWMGTTASANDEWLELFNTTASSINLNSWTVTIDSGTPITLTGSIPANGFYLMERTAETTTNVASDFIYTGGLNNSGGTITLRDPANNLIDTANGDGGAWPAGDSTNRLTMERINPTSAESDSNWVTNNGTTINGSDAGSNPIKGTPKQPNSSLSPTATRTNTPTLTRTLTPTLTRTLTLTATNFPARVVVINEVMWMGTPADSTDEWIELRNTTGASINLSGWTLIIDGSTVINLGGSIPAGGYYLLERTSDTTVSDIAADLIYTGGLNNGGGTLELRDPSNGLIDTANSDGGGWPAGDDSARASMERISSAPDTDGNWSTNYGHVTNGKDKNGNNLRATPKLANSNQFATPTPTAFARVTSIRINEVVPDPSSDWSPYGINRTPAEFIELYNMSDQYVSIAGWMIDDGIGGSSPYVFPSGVVMDPNSFWELYTAGLHISLKDDGDSARLLYPDGSVVDEVSWGTHIGDDRSISREPDGTGQWSFDWQPTPGMPNRPHKVGSKYGAKPTPIVAGIRQARTWDDGAWATLIGWITGPYPLFGSRVIYIQDGSGSGIALYLGSGTWPPMKLGQSITAAGYLRTRNGERELYVRNSWLFAFRDTINVVKPILIRTNEVNDLNEGTLVTITGKVVRLESSAFWIDDDSGATRVFFRSSLDFDRPPVKRGQVWSVTGIIGEFTTRESASKGHRVLVRFASDVKLLNKQNELNEPAPTATSLPEETGIPTLAPTETDMPTPTRKP